MTKKPKEPTDTTGMQLPELTRNTITMFVLAVRKQIAQGDLVATNFTALVALEKTLQREPGDDPKDLDRRVRELEPSTRVALMREWAKLDGPKGSGLA